MQIILPTWYGGVFGMSQSIEDYEVLALTKLSADARKMEPEAKANCWFDYVRLHPLQATYWFVELYRRIYKELSLKFFGEAREAYKHINQDFMLTREKNALYHLRQTCDLNGLEYGWAIRALMEFRLQTGEFKNRLPRPQHLLVDEEDLQNLILLWNGYNDGTVLHSSIEPFFLVSNWCGDPDQIRHEDYLVGQVKKKRVKHYALAELVHKRQVLRFERACMEFPDEIHDMLKDVVRLLPTVHSDK